MTEQQSPPASNGQPPPNCGDAERREKIKGVFSTQSVQKVGTGTTTRKMVKKNFWFVEELDGSEVEIQPLNVNYVPSGGKRRIPREDFLEKFSPEPEFYVSTVLPKMRELNQTVEKGEKHREKGETFSAEMEFDTALGIDEENVRANFGLGLTYLERGDERKANDIFHRLVKLEDAFEPEHKHLFNEFGINLRKNRMHDQALEYYKRALGLTNVDENLHYNIARAYFEKQVYDKCAEHLSEALRLNPALDEARRFADYLREKGLAEVAARPAVGGADRAESADKAEGGSEPGSGSGGGLSVDL
jgi:tetratricopeptide (TPR) repeat protein